MYRPPTSSLTDSLVFWSVPSNDDEHADEEEGALFDGVLEEPEVDGAEDKDKGKGKARESMYVALCEGAMTVE